MEEEKYFEELLDFFKHLEKPDEELLPPLMNSSEKYITLLKKLDTELKFDNFVDYFCEAVGNKISKGNKILCLETIAEHLGTIHKEKNTDFSLITKMYLITDIFTKRLLIRQIDSFMEQLMFGHEEDEEDE